jgi:membrane protease YdiL (CAAX protease family)
VTDALDRLKARHLLTGMMLAAIAVQLVVGAVAKGAMPDPRVVSIIDTVAMAGVVLLMARHAGLEWARVFGPPLTRESLAVVIPAVPVNIVAILMLIASGSVLLMLPLSYVAPTFVERFFLTPPPAFVARTPGQLLLLLVVGGMIAPIAEEVFFRGILMQRWARRWGTLTGVLASSALFALLHQEWLGRFAAGVLLSALYLRTRRLWAPIVAHALTNVLVIAPMGVYRLLKQSPLEHSTIADLREALPSAAWQFPLGVALVWGYVRLYWGEGLLGRILFGEVPYASAAELQQRVRTDD